MPLKLPKSRYYRVRIERLERYFKKSMSLRKTESYWLDKNNSKDKNCISILVNKTTKWKWRNERLNQVSAEQKIFKSKTGINMALEVFASCCHKLPTALHSTSLFANNKVGTAVIYKDSCRYIACPFKFFSEKIRSDWTKNRTLFFVSVFIL